MSQTFGISDGVSLTEMWAALAIVALWLVFVATESRLRRAIAKLDE